jgi:hypothetical protein
MAGVLHGAQTDIINAQAILAEHPNDPNAMRQLASAQAAYQQLLEVCGLELPTPTFTTAPAAMPGSTDLTNRERTVLVAITPGPSAALRQSPCGHGM